MLRLRKRYLPLVALLGAAVAVVPTLAQGASSGSVQADDFYYMPQTLAITTGGTVTFSEGGVYQHDVHFSGPLPSSCTNNNSSVTSAVGPSAADSTLPTASSQAWSGTCTFSQDGTYTFYCDIHHFTGTVYVNAAGTVPSTTSTSPPPTTTTTTTTTTPPPTTTGTTTTGTTTTPYGGGSSGGTTTSPTSAQGGSGGAPTAGAALSALRISSSQKGPRLRGSVVLGRAGSTVQINLVVAAAALARSPSRAPVSAGRLTMRRVGPGRVSFSVPLNARARRALRRRGRLRLVVKIAVTSPGGASATVNRTVTLHR